MQHSHGSLDSTAKQKEAIYKTETHCSLLMLIKDGLRWSDKLQCGLINQNFKFFLEIMEVSSRLKNKRISCYKDIVEKATLVTCSLLKASLMLNDFRETC